MTDTHPSPRYTAEGCEQCHGEPPAGFSCLVCLSFTDPVDGRRMRQQVFERFAAIKLGDTDELDPCWDRLMMTDGLFNLALAGIDNVVISRLFRVAVDATKGRP
jgi:hypothetical protein